MTYKIPPPWQSDYAIPAYVRAEGMRTRAFVTKWAPRGTYDDPEPFDPSWDKRLAIPQYIKDEGYGQGAKVTEWAPRGTYAGGNKPAVATGKKVALGDFAGSKLPASYNRFGQRAAAAVLKRVGALPQNSRRAALKKILDVIDPDLWSRSSQLAAELERQGVASATAVQTALARAMSEGAARELVETGKRRSAPSLNTVMGLGAYGPRAALGAVIGKGGEEQRTAPTMPTTQNAAPPTAGQCSPDGQYIWANGGWARRGVNQACTGTYQSFTTTAGGGAGTTVTNAGGEVVSGGTIATAPELAAAGLTYLRIGPWIMQDKEGSSVTDHRGLTAEQQQVLLKGMLAASARSYAHGARYTGNVTNLAHYGLGTGTTYVLVADAIEGTMPVAKFKHPTTGEVCVIYARFSGTKDAPAWTITWKLYTSFWEWLIGSLVELVAAILAPIIDAIKEVAQLACGLAMTTTGQVGAQIALTAGTTAAAGTAGAQIIQSACSSPTAPPPAPESSSSTPDWLVPVAIGGAILAGVVLFLPKKRKST